MLVRIQSNSIFCLLLVGTENGRRDVSAVKSNDWLFRGPGFDSQHPQRGSKLSMIPVLGYLALSAGFLCYCTPLVHRHADRLNTHTHKKT